MRRPLWLLLGTAAALIVGLPAIVLATPPVGQHDNGWSLREERALHVYATCWDKLGADCGRNIVDDGLAPDGRAPSDARIKEWTATMERWLHPPKPEPVQVAAPVSTSVAPAPATTSVPAPSSAPATSSGGYSIPSSIVECESGGNYGAVNSSSGAYGAYQIMPSTSAAYGCDMSTPAGQDACAAKIYSDVGSSAWSCG